MKRTSVIMLACMFIACVLNAQTDEKKTPLFEVKFSGFIKTDLFFDSRQVVTAREGHFLLYPENELLDADGNDINAKWNYNILNIQTRGAVSIKGPDALGAKTSGYIEGEFFGNINPNINTFRLRHAWIKFNWKSTELLTGQTWHPMFVPECSPATISFNTGAPFVVFSRNPQIRVTQKAGNFKFLVSVISQVDFTSTGPEGPSPKYLRNSVLPELNFQLQYMKVNKEKGIEWLLGAGIDYFMLTPRLSTTVTLIPAYDTVVNGLVQHIDAVTKTYKTDAKSTAIAANFFVKVRCRPVTMKMGFEYGDDNYAYTMIGGYAVQSVTDITKGFVDYANIRSCAIWGEIHTNGKKWQTGIFGAFSKNLGSPETITGPYYARGSNIDYLYRVSPRVSLDVNKVRIAGELEYTVAGYGTTTSKGYVADPKAVGNLRILLGIYYFF